MGQTELLFFASGASKVAIHGKHVPVGQKACKTSELFLDKLKTCLVRQRGWEYLMH